MIGSLLSQDKSPVGQDPSGHAETTRQPALCVALPAAHELQQ